MFFFYSSSSLSGLLRAVCVLFHFAYTRYLFYFLYLFSGLPFVVSSRTPAFISLATHEFPKKQKKMRLSFCDYKISIS